MIASGSSLATSSMFIPPLAEATSAGPFKLLSFKIAR